MMFTHKRAIIAALLILGGFSVLRGPLENHLSAVLPCEQPCHDALSCDPLEFSFEISPRKTASRKSEPLWYRARLKNRSCSHLEGIYVKEFLDSKNLRESVMGLWVAVTGPDGQEFERLPPPGPDGGIAWNYGDSAGVSISTRGTIYPYQPDFELINQLYRSKRVSEYDSVDLKPGESFASIPFRLRPYRIVATSVNSGESITDGTARVNVENPPAFPSPPEGFSLLDRYPLTRAGTYKIRAGYRADLRIHPVFARWERMPSSLAAILWKLGVRPPAFEMPHKREVRLVVSPITVTVIN